MTTNDHISQAEQSLDAAIKTAVEAGDIALAERIRNAAFHVANIVGVKIEEGDIDDE
jgi:N-acetylglucosamine-6-phosphate deacetylase